jgi:hypothetical protein
VFPKLDKNKVDSNYITSRAILSTKNDCVDRIIMKMINKFEGDERVYRSFDEAVDDPNNYHPSKFLNTLTPNGLPPHVLKLKKNCLVILLQISCHQVLCAISIRNGKDETIKVSEVREIIISTRILLKTTTLLYFNYFL